MAPEREPSSPAQDSLWPLALLGILVYVSGLFTWLKIKPINSQTKEEYPRDNTAHEKKPLAPSVANKLQTVESETDKNDATQKGRKVHPYLKFGVNVLTLLAVVWYACEAKKQRKAMQQQIPLMQQQVEGSMAAIITKQFRINWPTKQAYLSVILDNRGRVVGSDIRGDFQLTVVSLPDERIIGNALPRWNFRIAEIEVPPDSLVETGIYLDISQEELKALPNRPRAIKLTGTLAYFNGFRNKSDSVCYYVLGAVDFRNKLGAVQQKSGPTVIACGGLPAQLAWYVQTQKDTSQ